MTTLQSYLFLALGLKSRDEAAADEAFETAMRGIDRLMTTRRSTHSWRSRFLLPIVDQIDPALVPELFWRVIATRPPSGNPHPISESPQRTMVILLAWYDRAVAKALFEPGSRSHGTGRRPEVGPPGDGLFWHGAPSTPAHAVARLLQLPVDPKRDIRSDLNSRPDFRDARAGERGALAANLEQVHGHRRALGAQPPMTREIVRSR